MSDPDFVFGSLDGRDVRAFWLESPTLRVCVHEFGATLARCEARGRDGRRADVTVGLDSLEAYASAANPCLGGVPGRFANRIARGRCTVAGAPVALPCNNGRHHLHGGPDGFHRRVWRGTRVSAAAVRFELRSAAGDQGYPGALCVALTYTVDGDALVLDYEATCDAPTIVNLTNHAYFNLNPEQPTVASHVVQINAERVTAVDDELIPTGELLDVAGTPLDLREPTELGPRLTALDGFDHNFVLTRAAGDTEVLAATVHEPASGRRLRCYTTEPGLQLYTANGFDAQPGRDGRTHPKFGALCLEAQHFPDSPNQPTFPSTLLEPGSTYTQRTCYVFDTVGGVDE